MTDFNPNGDEREARLDSRDPARIAALTGIAEDQVVELVSQLERQRVIRGYKTVVDWDRLGDERVVAFIDVSVSPQR